jgi:hypothetical protein
MGTLSKALGASGGYICGSRSMIEWLINRARSFIFSTAPPPALAAAANAAVDFVSSPGQPHCSVDYRRRTGGSGRGEKSSRPGILCPGNPLSNRGERFGAIAGDRFSST